MLMFADWRMLTQVSRSVESAGLIYRSLIVWDKVSIGPGMGFRAQHEMCLAFTAGVPKVCHTGTANVLRCKRTRNAHHPTQKPVTLLRQMLDVVTAPGDLVVDPFMGSGSTGVAAVSGGRRFIGSDLSPQHVATAAQRISEAGADVLTSHTAPTPQPGLFSGTVVPL